MTPPRVPVPDPVTFELSNGIKLTTFISPQTRKHSVNCDLCGFTVHLSISASGSNLHSHRNSDVCKKIAFKLGGKINGIDDKKIEKFLEWENKQQTPAEDDPEQLGENNCGFCG